MYRDIKATLEVNVVSDDDSIEIIETIEERLEDEPELPAGDEEVVEETEAVAEVAEDAE